MTLFQLVNQSYLPHPCCQMMSWLHEPAVWLFGLPSTEHQGLAPGRTRSRCRSGLGPAEFLYWGDLLSEEWIRWLMSGKQRVEDQDFQTSPVLALELSVIARFLFFRLEVISQ
jgi:hypothetical protein